MKRAESIFRLFNLFLNKLVFGLEIFNSLSIFSFPSFNFCDNAIFKANFLIFFGNLCSWDLTWGPKMTAPPLIWGDLLLPWRALPVPFCLKGFLVVPEISDIPLVLWFPLLLLASWYLIILWMIFSSISIPKTDLSRSISLSSLLSILFIFSFILFFIF